MRQTAKKESLVLTTFASMTGVRIDNAALVRMSFIYYLIRSKKITIIAKLY